MTRYYPVHAEIFVEFEKLKAKLGNSEKINEEAKKLLESKGLKVNRILRIHRPRDVD